jgi:hypothetical protein
MPAITVDASSVFLKSLLDIWVPLIWRGGAIRLQSVAGFSGLKRPSVRNSADAKQSLGFGRATN